MKPFRLFSMALTLTLFVLSMNVFAEKSLESVLRPEVSPYNEGHLKVSDIHSIYYAEYGNPEGVPVIYVHGGPGAGASPEIPRFFDLEYYRVILVAQRGSPKSKPFLELKDNNTQALIADMEKLREALKIKRWILYGGS